jgi:hypothetical protein
MAVLEVEIQRNERPFVAQVRGARSGHDGANALEEIAQRGFLFGEWLTVRQDRASGTQQGRRPPDEILLNREWHAGRRRAVETIGPLTLVRIGIVGVEKDPPAWKGLAGGYLRGECSCQ